MPTIQTFYLGGLRTEAEHVFSGNKVITDAPLDNQGKAESFSPSDMLSASLASCMMTIMGIAARTQGFEEMLIDTRIETTKIMQSDPRRVAEIKVEFFFPGSEFNDKQKKILEHAAHTCPVALSLREDLIQTVSFNF